MSVEITNLKKDYCVSSINSVNILNGISLSIKRGEVIILLGPSGSGKSTLLNLISGLETPTEGNIFINGEEFSSIPIDRRDDIRRKEMGIVFQFFELHQNLTCKETLELTLILGDKINYLKKDSIKTLLIEVGLKERINSLISQLSRGEKQRVAIARSLITNPKILVADEPTGALDKDTSQKIMKILRSEVKKSNKTLIIATHDYSIIESTDKVIKMYDGKIKLE